MMLAGCSFFAYKECSPSAEYELVFGGQRFQDFVQEVSHELSLYGKSINSADMQQSPVLLLAPLKDAGSDADMTDEFMQQLLPKLLQQSFCRIVTLHDSAFEVPDWQSLAIETGSDYLLSFLFKKDRDALPEGYSGDVVAELQLTELSSKEVVWHKRGYLHEHLQN